eukprot:4024153-Pleurochrysis_carterae.AAC.4
MLRGKTFKRFEDGAEEQKTDDAAVRENGLQGCEPTFRAHAQGGRERAGGRARGRTQPSSCHRRAVACARVPAACRRRPEERAARAGARARQA